MPKTATWYSFDELLPHDKEWVLVADDRFETPVKALYKYDFGGDNLYHIGHTNLTDASYLTPDGSFEHAYAWMPLPPMPTREQMQND